MPDGLEMPACVGEVRPLWVGGGTVHSASDTGPAENADLRGKVRPLRMGRTGTQKNRRPQRRHPLMIPSTSSRTFPIVASSRASALSRSSGSVLDGRTLNHQSAEETVRPSSSSRVRSVWFS